MRYYVDQGAGMESRPYDAHEIVSFLHSWDVPQACLEQKFGWSNMPEVVVFEGGMYQMWVPEFSNWFWENGLSVWPHWKE